MDEDRRNIEINEIKVRIDYIEKGIEKTELMLNKRLEGMNEFRAALKDQNMQFVTRVEYEGRHEQICDKIDFLQKLVFVGLGLVLAVEFFLRFLK
jgi:hypothetical protein